jgi:hypothetical protein
MPAMVSHQKKKKHTIVVLSTSIVSKANADLSGTKLSFRSLSSSCNLKEIPRTGPLEIRFIKCVVNPAILFLKRLLGIMATSAAIFLLVWKSRVRRG